MLNARLLKLSSRAPWLNGLILAATILVSACGGGGGGHWEAVPDQPFVKVGGRSTDPTSAHLSGTAFVSPAAAYPYSAVTIRWNNVTSGASGLGHSELSCQYFFGNPVLCKTVWSADVPLVGDLGNPNQITIQASDPLGNVAYASITLAPSAPPDTTPPSLSFAMPTSGANGVPINSVVSVTFSETVDPTSVNDWTFSLNVLGGGHIAGSITVSDRTATFTPATSFMPATTYEVFVFGIRDPAGNYLASDYLWWFTTGTQPDTTPPSVSVTSPADGASCAAVDNAITATFDEPIDPRSINPTTMQLQDAVGNLVSGAVTSTAENTATFSPQSQLTDFSQYSGVLTTDVKDLAGNSLANDYVWSFTTATTGSWQPITTLPSARKYHTAVWTGREMIVWGGYDDAPLNTGGRYDPITDSWVPTSTVGAPGPRSAHVAVWTGNEMIVWGNTGGDNTGGRYDPQTDTWRPTSVIGARQLQSAKGEWTGNEMIVVGITGGTVLNGERYDPSSDSWQTITTWRAPLSRSDYSIVWTGTEIIVWGGDDVVNGWFNDGARYDPQSNTWTPVSTDGAPSARRFHSAVWTGSEMIIWGGEDEKGNTLNTGARYNPLTDTWQPLTMSCAPRAREHNVAVWTGNRMLVWSGSDGDRNLNSGAAYDPVTDSWTATSTATLVPFSARSHATTVWAGDRMIVWGGWADPPGYLNTGGSYSP